MPPPPLLPPTAPPPPPPIPSTTPTACLETEVHPRWSTHWEEAQLKASSEEQHKQGVSICPEELALESQESKSRYNVDEFTVVPKTDAPASW